MSRETRRIWAEIEDAALSFTAATRRDDLEQMLKFARFARDLWSEMADTLSDEATQWP